MSFTKGRKITVDFDPADTFEGRYSCRIACDSIPFERLRQVETAEALRIEATITSTAQRAGFYYVGGWPQEIRRHLTTTGPKGIEPRKLVDAFRDQGFSVEIVGAYRAGRIASAADLKSETAADRERAQADERRHVETRRAEAELSRREAVQSLRTAARREERPAWKQSLAKAMGGRVRDRQTETREVAVSGGIAFRR